MAKPIIFEIDEKVDDNFCQKLEETIRNNAGEKSPYLLNYPTIYIHDYELSDGKHEVYIGESNDVVNRTSNHYLDRKDDKKWQSKLFVNDRHLKMYIIGHEHANKSLTLDIENKLINYMMSSENVSSVHNSRGNPQDKYYPNEEFNTIFDEAWTALRRYNNRLFLSRSKIEDSAIFKASPLHKLTEDQILNKKIILNSIYKALGTGLDHQLVFVEGDAGTGKTVLISRLFYELLQQNKEEDTTKINCCLMVNHDEQKLVYDEIIKKLNLENADGSTIVYKPTSFINNHSCENKIDVAFVDEGHLLLTQGKQAYRGKNQLEDIIERAKVTVVMFDENQVLTSEEYWEPEKLKSKIQQSVEQNNYISLNKQIRIKAQKETIDWIDSITKDGQITELKHDPNYEIKTFDSPEELYEAIKKKSEKEEYSLSRIVASYDWPYNANKKPTDAKTWNVKIGSFEKPWNREIYRYLNSGKEKNRLKNLAWAEQPQTIDEIGSTFTIQGFDLSYAGVIIGPSVKFENGKIKFHPENNQYEKVKMKKTLSDGSKKSFAEEFIKHELRVLLTRGVNGLYIYAVDDNLRAALRNSIK